MSHADVVPQMMKLWGANLTLNQDLDFSLASASTNTWINVRHFLGQKELQGKEEYKKLKQRKKLHYCSFYLCPPSPADRSSWHCLSFQWAIILASTLVCVPCLCKLLYSHHCPGTFLSSIDGGPVEASRVRYISSGSNQDSVGPHPRWEHDTSPWEPGSL